MTTTISLDEAKTVASALASLSGMRKATQLPVPSGYRILCAVPEAEEKTSGGVIKADVTRQNEELLTTVLFVVKMGPDCYKDEKRFPSGPWCEEGDFILVRPHAGTRVKIHGKDFRIINDDSVEAVVEDPRGYSRN
ncbi:MAG: 10 kDa chaperonin [Chloroflexi bacterium]|nr:10 kDa chaperonin [Chloroflexota bacterium]